MVTAGNTALIDHFVMMASFHLILNYKVSFNKIFSFLYIWGNIAITALFLRKSHNTVGTANETEWFQNHYAIIKY